MRSMCSFQCQAETDDSATRFQCSAKLILSAKSAKYCYNQPPGPSMILKCVFRNTRSPSDRTTVPVAPPGDGQILTTIFYAFLSRFFVR